MLPPIFSSHGFPNFSIKNERTQKRNLVYAHCHTHWLACDCVLIILGGMIDKSVHFFLSLTPQKCKCPGAEAFSCFTPCCISSPSIRHLLFKRHPSEQWTNKWTMCGRCSIQVMQQVLLVTDVSCWSKVYVLNADLNICSFFFLEMTICQALTAKF